jgi:hypothetical protein
VHEIALIIHNLEDLNDLKEVLIRLLLLSECLLGPVIFLKGKALSEFV